MTEIELARPVVEWLKEQHWDVYQEVQLESYGRIADIVAVRGKCIWIIEYKTSLSLKVIEQASKHWQCHCRSVAVPMGKTTDRWFKKRIMNLLNIGLIEVSKPNYKGNMTVCEEYKGNFQRLQKQTIHELLFKLRPEHKNSEAGSRGGGYLTAYSRTMHDIREIISCNPGYTLKEIMTTLQHHYASEASARTCIKKALAEWETEWCRIEIDGKANRYFVKEGA